MFRSKHRRLCAPPFCVKETPEEECNSKCGFVNSSLASRICKELTPVIKSIRFIEIEGLEKMAEENNLDLKIIFLAREQFSIEFLDSDTISQSFDRRRSTDTRRSIFSARPSIAYDNADAFLK